MGLDPYPGRERTGRRVDRHLPSAAGSGRRRSSARRSRSSPGSTPATPSGPRSSPPSPRFRDLEVKHGSLVRGMWAAPRPRPAPGASRGGLLLVARGAARDGGRASSCASSGSGSGRTPPCARSGARGTAFSLAVQGGETVSAARVIVAAPGPRIAPALEPSCPGAARALAAVPFASSATVLLGFRARTWPTPSAGTAWWSRGRRAPHDGAQLRLDEVPAPGPRGPRAPPRLPGRRARRRGDEADRREMVETVKRDMGGILGLRGEPTMSRVFRWPGGHRRSSRWDTSSGWRRSAGGGLGPRPPPDRGRHPDDRIPDSVADGTRAGDLAGGGGAVRGALVALALLFGARHACRGAGQGRGQRRRGVRRARPGLPLRLRLVRSPGGRRA